ncbi:hypothetical protein D2T29_12330 [Sinirhodobacter populi]|uniref:Uncharacterized protein n=1 Tax=Paenirhodobacter populi TaxID=2306993 RepID=A0A443KCS9_9RHOB|nr:hypothetical protein [Sinirhodobacter populi]RWR30452.1 hypothetical protein D2T29_12330 [Sinirhodobacter populi]
MPNVWIITVETPQGVAMHPFYSESARDEWALGWCARHWDYSISGPMPATWPEALANIPPDYETITCHEAFGVDEHPDLKPGPSWPEDEAPHPHIAAYGFTVQRVSEFMAEAPEHVLGRFNANCARFGSFVLWDRNDDEDGFMLCLPTIAELNAEFLFKAAGFDPIHDHMIAAITE